MAQGNFFAARVAGSGLQPPGLENFLQKIPILGQEIPKSQSWSAPYLLRVRGMVVLVRVRTHLY